MEAFVAIGIAFNKIFGKLSFICSQTVSMIGALGDYSGWWTIVAVLFKIMSMWRFIVHIVHIKESQIIFSKLKCISCFNRRFSKFSSRSNLGWLGLLKDTL